jgi:GNAT superfamily N-acetyltransferase
MIEIRHAALEEMDAVRALFREYQQAIGVSLCFQSFEEELAGLPGAYAPPRGRLLIAIDGELAGCVALRPAGEAAEVKRLYVRDRWKGQGLGRRLMARLIEEAHTAGYRRLVLDTLPSMTAAHALYRSLGFTVIEPFAADPHPGALCFGRQL